MLDETSPQGTGVLADLCRSWEQSTAPAAERGIRVVTIRTGIVLGGAGGADGGILAANGEAQRIFGAAPTEPVHLGVGDERHGGLGCIHQPVPHQLRPPLVVEVLDGRELPPELAA